MYYRIHPHAAAHWFGRCGQRAGLGTAGQVALAARPADDDKATAARAYFGSRTEDAYYLVSDGHEVVFLCVPWNDYVMVLSCTTIPLIVERLLEFRERDRIASRRARKRYRRLIDRQPESGRSNRRPHAREGW
jgi:hypothetical protein